jgi:hypothetical protein
MSSFLANSLGAPVDIADDRTVLPRSLLVTRCTVLSHAMLEDAAGNLKSAGSTFPFVFHSGVCGLSSTPGDRFFSAIQPRHRRKKLCVSWVVGMRRLLSACAGSSRGVFRVFKWAAATSLADLNRGAYNIYSTAPGDQPNRNSFAVQNFIFAHASHSGRCAVGAGRHRMRATRVRFVPLASPVAPPQGT